MYTTTCERLEAGCARLSASVPALMEDQQNDDDDGNHDRSVLERICRRRHFMPSTKYISSRRREVKSYSNYIAANNFLVWSGVGLGTAEVMSWDHFRGIPLLYTDQTLYYCIEFAVTYLKNSLII
jgi:hypothetical protein